jgi:hypothetical protein
MGGFMRVTAAPIMALCLHCISTSAFANDPACLEAYTFRGDQHTEGSLETRPGKACTSRIRAFGNTTMRSIQVVQAPKNATVTILSESSYRFAPRANFSGQDSMVLRFNMNGNANKPSSGTVTFRITVR